MWDVCRRAGAAALPAPAAFLLSDLHRQWVGRGQACHSWPLESLQEGELQGFQSGGSAGSIRVQQLPNEACCLVAVVRVSNDFLQGVLPDWDEPVIPSVYLQHGAVSETRLDDGEPSGKLCGLDR